MSKYVKLFERDMTIRGLRESTRKEYQNRLRNFAEFLGRSPAKATLATSRSMGVYMILPFATASGAHNHQ